MRSRPKLKNLPRPSTASANDRKPVKRRTVQEALAEAQDLSQEDGFVWKCKLSCIIISLGPKKMIDENTQTDEIMPNAAKKTEKVAPVRPVETIWIPLEKSAVDQFTTELPRTASKNETSVQISLPAIKVLMKIDDSTADKEIRTDSNLLEICKQFLCSPILQLLDLSVLQDLEEDLS